MPNALRFLFTGNSVLKVIANTIQVEDVEPGGPAGDPAAGSMRITFRQSDPGPAQICPLLPGKMQFLVDANAQGTIPNPNTDPFTVEAAEGWKTRGRILIIVGDATASEIAGFAPLLLVKPTRMWYGPVTLPPAFLFETLTGKNGGAGLKKGPIPTASGTFRGTNENWFKHAIANFLGGRYLPLLEAAADAAQDDRVRFVMPTVVVEPDGSVVLNVTTALAQNPRDASDSEFDDPPPPVSREEPTHPRNGRIPAREVYRQLRPHMVAEAAAAAPVVNAVLADWPVAPRFFPIRITRTCEPVEDCSLFFPRQTVNIRMSPTTVQQDSLPAHGIVYVRQDPPPIGQPFPVPPLVEVSLENGTMKWLAGGGTSWRQPAGTTPLPIDLAGFNVPHISARLPMREAMFSDTTRPINPRAACTYLSLRRTVRALVDNRIAGGRLNFGVHVTGAPTRALLRNAFAGTPATVAGVAANAPDPFGDPDVLALRLEPLLQAFFPNNAAQVNIPGAPAAPTVHDEGEVAYRLWQSILESFQENQTKRNFADQYIGRGGPGSAAYVNLVTLQVDPVRNAGETDAAYFDRIITLMFGLEPGALLQFWNRDSDYLNIKNRAVPGAPPRIAEYGHSPVFVRYARNNAAAITGLVILDQSGESISPITGAVGQRRIRWGGAAQAIWIAANWTE